MKCFLVLLFFLNSLIYSGFVFSNPPNSHVIYGDMWMCNNGYQRQGDSCVKINVPANAHAVGGMWMCNMGYKKNGQGCTEMSKEEKIQQLLILSTIKSTSSSCSSLESYASDAYRDAKSAYYSDNIDDCQHYSNKAKRHASDAESSGCTCSDAESYASDIYSYSKKAYYSDDLDDCQYYARKAMSYAGDAESSASNCSDD